MRLTLATALVSAGALAATALAADLPSSTAVAQRGQVKIVSRALLSAKGAELKGTWYHSARACTAQRTLRVSYLVDLVRGSATTRRSGVRSGLAENCAEGGPNFGFDVTASGLGMACPNGRWRPGRYSIVVRTFDAVSRLRAIATLYYQETRRC